jgi:hypothetical protein
MPSYIGLPVYKSSYDIFLLSFKLIRNLNKDYKYTVGEKLKNEIMELMINVYKANKGQSKEEKIKKAQENIEVVKILFRLLKDLNQISLKSFVEVNEKIEEVSRQLFGWQKTLNN